MRGGVADASGQHVSREPRVGLVSEPEAGEVLRSDPPELIMFVLGHVAGFVDPFADDSDPEVCAIGSVQVVGEVQGWLAGDRGADAQLLVELAREGGAGLLTRLDVSAGEVPAVRVVEAGRGAVGEEDAAGVHECAGCDEVCHGLSTPQSGGGRGEASEFRCGTYRRER